MVALKKNKIAIREAESADIEELIPMIAAVFEEYKMEFVAEEELPDFLDFKNSYRGKNKLFVAEHQATKTLAGCTAIKVENELPRLSRVYVRKKDRGNGIGKKLIARAVDYAKNMGFDWIHLWTDTRFERAHQFYKTLGYTYTGRVKPLNDINNSYEYHFKKFIGKK